MTTLSLLATVAPTRLDPIRLFLDADIVVQVVMGGLLLASLWVWTIIISFSLRMGRLRSRTIAYESEFWQAENFDRFTSERGNKDIPAARVAHAAVDEWRRSTRSEVRDREALRQRIAAAMDSQIALEADDIAERLNFLATVGSVAPFVGLFAAIPAVIDYNRFSHRVDRYEARLQRFADKLGATFSRQLEQR
jgi:biopolymer transport protein TolQ